MKGITLILIFTLSSPLFAAQKKKKDISLRELSVNTEKEEKKLPKVYDKFVQKKGAVAHAAENAVKKYDGPGFSIGVQDEFLEKAYQNGVDLGQTFRGINLVRPPVKGEVKFIF